MGEGFYITTRKELNPNRGQRWDLNEVGDGALCKNSEDFKQKLSLGPKY
jgi:hypothetical protein